MQWRRLFRSLKLLILSAIVALLLAPEWPAFESEAYQLNAIVGLRQFDFLVWELNAVWAKGKAILTNGHTYLNKQVRKKVVLDYLDLVQQVSNLDSEIDGIYTDPRIDDPNGASSGLQAELAQKRQSLSQLQPVAEAIIQEQVADILIEQGFGIVEQAWPPVMMHMTPVPYVLIVSPRDRIERTHQVALIPGLSTPAREEIETAVFDSLNLSALVVPIGGLGTYPAMIMETSSINWLATIISHEWAHHWLQFYPLGLHYGSNAEARTINETVASIVEQEIGTNVIERYYPEFVPPPPENPPATATEPDASAPPSFDFQAEMAETRVTTDRLLTEGKIEAAEMYMEARRRFFVNQGYRIRKLNQAYFAFYGAYADEPGATGADPIGPMLWELRKKSPSLRAFLERVAVVTTLEDLREALRSVNEGK